MMKKYLKIIVSLLCAVLFVLPLVAGCGDNNSGSGNGDNPPSGDVNPPSGDVNPPSGDVNPPSGGEEPEPVDYVAALKLDMTSNTKKQEVTVRLYIDGDTTHFDPVTNSTLTDYNADDFKDTFGYIKARYLAIDTPESTGDIEKWGKTASNFTRSKLESASKIIVESDDDKWNVDSTSSKRYTLWVWYMPKGETEFRNLNVEILQNGFAYGSSTANNRYGEIASAALDQARSQKLHVYAPASVKDENFYEGEAFNIDLKTLRLNITEYVQKTVSVIGIVSAVYDHYAFIEEYDEESECYFGMTIFYGYQTGAIEEVLSVGNEVRVIGAVTYYEAGGTYQISGVHANKIRPQADDCTVISTGHKASFAELDPKDIISGSLTANLYIEDEEGNETTITRTIAYGEAVLSTSVTLKNLKVIDTYTTSEGESTGAFTLTCEAEDGTQIDIRTTVLKENGVIVPASRFMGKTITVKGIMDKYTSSWDSPYQLKVHRLDYIQIVE